MPLPAAPKKKIAQRASRKGAASESAASSYVPPVMSEADSARLIQELGNLMHHAYFIEGNESHAKAVCEHVEKVLVLRFVGNADAVTMVYPTFGVDEARALIAAERNAAVQEGRRVFIVQTGAITLEAQHGILKLLEEPSPQTLLVFVVPDAAGLLPTILSRVVLVRSAGRGIDSTAEVEAFLALPLAERLKKTTAIAEHDNARDIVRSYIDAAITLAYRKVNKKDKAWAMHMGRLLELKQWINGRSPRIKMILETLALLDF